jgi:DeoR/GlpR family transcriptional regulator of sugar metabolism
LIAFWFTVKRFTVKKAALSLDVSMRTIERDLVFLKAKDLLGPRRNSVMPYIVVESGSEFMARFNAAHQSR